MKLRLLSGCYILAVILVCSLSCSGCGSGSSDSSVVDPSDDGSSSGTAAPALESDIYYSALTNTSDWTEATHEKLSTDEIIANIDVVFDKTSVQKLRIVIEPENWALMNQNLSDLKNELGGSSDFNSIDKPFCVPSEVFHYSETDGWREWYKVGVRFKGNSSLYHANSGKLPFKLDFDEFENEYPAIDNQRFYGFKQLNLKNNYTDESEMHEIIANELFRDFGLVGAHSSFYVLNLNVDGSNDEDNDIYYGLYTLVEEVDDTVIKTQYYGDHKGNLYKPEDDAATFARGTYSESEYDLKDGDETYEDVRALYNSVNHSSRTTDPAAWKSNLEAIFNVDIFLKWLAANTVMENWDTYGLMSHNFYLYNRPSDNTIQWIPWDNNEALISSRWSLSLNMASVSSNWPLIRYILDVDEYETRYKGYVQNFSNSYFNLGSSTEFNVNDRYDTYQTLIKDWVEAEGDAYTFTSEPEFANAVSQLKIHTTSRYNAAKTYVGW